MISLKYMAGFIDGEGCFDVYIARGITLSVSIVNTNIDILQEISDAVVHLTGVKPRKIITRKGSLSFYDSYDRKDMFTLRIGAPALRIILPKLVRFMRVKKYQAETMLELLRLTPPKSAGNNSFELVKHRYWEERVELVDKIHWANQGYP